VVERPALPERGPVSVLIVQPLLCMVRWDRFLAREHGSTRSDARRAWAAGRIRIEPRSRLNLDVRDGQRVHLER
jgi:hypothetical protein